MYLIREAIIYHFWNQNDIFQFLYFMVCPFMLTLPQMQHLLNRINAV